MPSPRDLVIGLLVHQDYSRVSALVDFFIRAEIRSVIHVDKNSVELAKKVSNKYQANDLVRVISTNYCKWGEWSLVQAELDIYQQVFNSFSDCKHVHFMSGADMPLKPMSEFLAFLANNQEHDFVELVDIERNRFIIEGPQLERIIYRYPFNFLSQRRLFEFFTKSQKVLRLKRNMPNGLLPHMGGQFKTLRYTTVVVLLEMIKERRELIRFFSKSWIPDESFIATLVATLYSENKVLGIPQSSLTYRVFDISGKPIVINKKQFTNYRYSQFYFARKFDSSEELEFSYLNENRPQQQQNLKPEIIKGFDDSICLLIWDSEFDQSFNQSHTRLATGEKLFCGAIDEIHDREHDKYVKWASSPVGENELRVWRVFRREAPASYLTELVKLNPNGVSLSLHIDSIRKYGFEDLIKDGRITLVIYPQFLSDLRFDQIKALRESAQPVKPD
jgi:hypothetical protein